MLGADFLKGSEVIIFRKDEPCQTRGHKAEESAPLGFLPWSLVPGLYQWSAVVSLPRVRACCWLL